MIRFAVFFAAVITSVVLWYECGEDIVVFCYRIGLGAFAMLRTRALIPVPVAQMNFSRNRSACSNPSSTSSTRSTPPTDYEN
jgi:hypothetical protein